MDIVIQGKIFPGTFQTAVTYEALDFVDRVIISTWDDEPTLPDHDSIIVVRSTMPYTAPMNLNLQLVSTNAGLDVVDTDMVIKMRSDQRVTPYSMNNIRRFTDTFGFDIMSKFVDGSGPRGPIYIIGQTSEFAYHPQDHIFWGYTEDVKRLFSCPMYKEGGAITPTYEGGFHEHVRIPCYFGAHYHAHFNPLVYTHIDNFMEYLVDGAPKKQEALDLSASIQDDIFRVMPRIDMWWEKYQTGYKYDLYEPQSEYYYDKPW